MKDRKELIRKIKFTLFSISAGIIEILTFTLLDNIKQDDAIKDNIIYIETERVPEEISREFAQTFEQEIECLIKAQLKAAGERIKKGLSGKMELYPSSKRQEKSFFPF